MIQSKVFLYAHNAKGFDNYLVMEQENLKFTKIINHNGIGSLTVSNLKNASITLRCTMSHQMGSLSKLCESYNIPQQYCKSSMNHDQVTQENYKSLRSEWEPYLRLDVISLGLVWASYLKSIGEVLQDKEKKFVDIRGCISSASLAFQEFMRGCKESGIVFRQFNNAFVKSFVRKAIHGGRVAAYRREFKSSCLDYVKGVLIKWFGTDDLFSACEQILPSQG
jgi:hypothetical protein